MYKIFYFWLAYSFCFMAGLYASASLPTPFVNGVNVITGETLCPDSTLHRHTYYTQGFNEVSKGTIELKAKDFRIGRVKMQETWEQESQTWYPSAYFFYEPDYTEVYDHHQNRSVYHYSSAHLIHKIEQYQAQATLYRQERFFWDTSSSTSRLISRVLEDGQGQAEVCYLLQYSPHGQVIQETIAGNLSGNCQAPLIILANGYPEKNGIESYTIYYEYSKEDPTLIVKKTEDNGAINFYRYHPKLKECICKLLGDQNGIVSRCFYEYDEQGFLKQMITDDGSGLNKEDLEGVTTRQMNLIQICQEGPALGQPLCIENKYLDIKTGQEIVVEKTIHQYSSEGLLIQKDFYVGNDILKYNLKMIYDDKGEILEVIDSRNKPAKEVNEPENALQYRYNQFQQPIAQIDKYGNETEYVYDTFGRLTQTIYPAVLDQHDQLFRPTVKQDYDVRDRVNRIQDANGNICHNSYNSRGQPTLLLYPDGSKDQCEYFLDGTIKKRIAKNGLQTILERDAFGHVLAIHEKLATDEIVSSIFYTYKGNYLTKETDGKTFTIHFSYDGLGRLTGMAHETEEGIKKREWSYDAEGQLLKKKETPSIAPRSDLFTSHTQELSTCNDRGQYVRQQEITQANGIKEVHTYDALNRLEKSEGFDPFGVKLYYSSWRYDGNGNKVLEKHSVLVKGEEQRSYTNTWAYDAFNHVICLAEGIESSQQKICYYKYNTFEQLEQIIKPDGTQIDHTYNALGKLSRMFSSDGTIDYTYTYDESQRLIHVEDHLNQFSLERSYNQLNALKEESFNALFALKYDYDSDGRCTVLTLPDATSICYDYTKEGLQAIRRRNSNQQDVYTHTYLYDTTSKKPIAHQLIGDLGVVNHDYDANGSLVGIRSPWWSETLDQFDSSYNLMQMSICDTKGSYQQNFEYSFDNQLINEIGDHQNSYTYDSLYNRLTHNEETWSTNEHNQLMSTPKASYRYDLNGNLIEKSVDNRKIIYEYDALNRLIRITEDQNQAIEYLYDTLYRRLRQTCYNWDSLTKAWVLKEVSYELYEGEKEIGRLNEAGQLIELRVLGLGKGAEIGSAVAIELQGHLYAPIHDHRGSVCCLLDVEQKTVAECYRYSAYGVESIFDGEGQQQLQTRVANPWRFASKRCDPTDLIFYGKRYYDPSTGRWLTPDPLSFYDAPNLYAFVRNNPMTHYDLYGLFTLGDMWSLATKPFVYFWNYCQRSSLRTRQVLKTELRIPDAISSAFDRIGRKILGGNMLNLLGYQCDELEVGEYGEKEVSSKVRVTFINGILTTRDAVFENYEVISKSHGGIKIHYVFCPTQGWTSDMLNAILVKFGFAVGIRPYYSYLLADLWKKLIQEMGGVEGGGKIVHYAHSLGGSITDRARGLLTPEEQKMIHIITFGSATLLRNEGYGNVTNYVSIHDGVSFLDILGHLRNYFDPKRNVIFSGPWFSRKFFPRDHVLAGKTYSSILLELGEQFILDFIDELNLESDSE